MTRSASAAILVVSLALVACGGGDRTRTIGSLDRAEAEDECRVFGESLGGPGEHDCSGTNVTVQTVDACADNLEPATCDRTLAELDACIAAVDGDACGLIDDPACAFLVECAMARP